MLSKPGIKKIVFPFCTVCLGLAIPLVILEIVFRLIWAAPLFPLAIGSIRNDPDTGIRLAANYDGFIHTENFSVSVRTNSLGLRDLERPYAKSSGVFRILALGDSYVEGQGVDFGETFLRQAEKAINRSHAYKDKVEIIKAGVGGWGPMDELTYLRQKGYRYSPDAVMVVFFAGNDYTDALCPKQFVEHRGIRLSRDKLSAISRSNDARLFLRKHVYVYGFLVDALKRLTLRKTEEFSEYKQELAWSKPGEGPPTSGVESAVDGFSKWSNQYKIPLCFVILPHRVQVETTHTDEILHWLNMKRESFDFDQLSRLVAGILDKKGIPYFDATACLRSKAADGTVIGFRSDTHYTGSIHEFLGHELADYIRRQILDPP